MTEAPTHRLESPTNAADVPPSDRTVPARSGPGRVTLAVVVCVGVVAGGIAGAAIDRATGGATATTAATGSCPAAAVANTVLPSVVTIAVQNGGAGGNGSGEIIRDGGYILTNDHVISPAVGGGRVQVLFTSGQTEAGTIVGRAPALDLAVVKVPDQHRLPVIATGDDGALRVGQPVVALGAPLGLSGTVTGGIVSAIGRDVSVPTGDGTTTATLPGSIQTDASINPGNSGGALVDCRSRLVGVNTAIATVPSAAGQPSSGSVGIGFAIPVGLATTVADQLIATGRFVPPYTGVSTVSLPASVAAQSGVRDGLFVQAVNPNGPGAQAGLRPGDLITEVDGHKATEPNSLVLRTVRKKPGDRVRLHVVRDGTSNTVTMSLTTAPGGG
jgi:putative serine protease PepD